MFLVCFFVEDFRYENVYSFRVLYASFRFGCNCLISALHLMYNIYLFRESVSLLDIVLMYWVPNPTQNLATRGRGHKKTVCQTSGSQQFDYN